MNPHIDLYQEQATREGDRLKCDLERMRRVNQAFADRSNKTTYRNVVKFEHDESYGENPWLLWVADEMTCYPTLADALEGAEDSLLEAAQIVAVCREVCGE